MKGSSKENLCMEAAALQHPGVEMRSEEQLSGKPPLRDHPRRPPRPAGGSRAAETPADLF